jgi:hypothetical protein
MVKATVLLLPVLGARILAERNFQKTLRMFGREGDKEKLNRLWGRFWKALGRPDEFPAIASDTEAELLKLAQTRFTRTPAARRAQLEFRLEDV